LNEATSYSSTCLRRSTAILPRSVIRSSSDKLTGKRREIVLFGLEAHNWTQGRLRAGVIAADVAKDFYKFFLNKGYKDNFVYGPMHGTGLIEVEAPWVETTSNYTSNPI